MRDMKKECINHCQGHGAMAIAKQWHPYFWLYNSFECKRNHEVRIERERCLDRKACALGLKG